MQSKFYYGVKRINSISFLSIHILNLSIMATQSIKAAYKAKVKSQLNRIKLVKVAAQSKQPLLRELRSLIQLTQAHKA